MTETTDFAQLDELYRAGILTEDEHAEAERKLRARGAVHLVHVVHARHAAASASRQPRHAKPPRRRWPAIATALVLLVAAAVTVAVLARPKHHHSQASRPPALQSTAQSSPIILGAPANSAVAINLDGANAQITVSSLTLVPTASTPAKQAVSTAKKLVTIQDTTYSASVTAVGVSGSFALDPSSFSAHSATGQSFAATPVAQNSLTRTTVGAGQEVQAKIAFTVPSGQHIAAILFTTPLGEQLGLWSIS